MGGGGGGGVCVQGELGGGEGYVGGVGELRMGGWVGRLGRSEGMDGRGLMFFFF